MPTTKTHGTTLLLTLALSAATASCNRITSKELPLYISDSIEQGPPPSILSSGTWIRQTQVAGNAELGKILIKSEDGSFAVVESLSSCVEFPIEKRHIRLTPALREIEKIETHTVRREELGTITFREATEAELTTADIIYGEEIFLHAKCPMGFDRFLDGNHYLISDALLVSEWDLFQLVELPGGGREQRATMSMPANGAPPEAGDNKTTDILALRLYPLPTIEAPSITMITAEPSSISLSSKATTEVSLLNRSDGPVALEIGFDRPLVARASPNRAVIPGKSYSNIQLTIPACYGLSEQRVLLAFPGSSQQHILATVELHSRTDEAYDERELACAIAPMLKNDTAPSTIDAERVLKLADGYSVEQGDGMTVWLVGSGLALAGDTTRLENWARATAEFAKQNDVTSDFRYAANLLQVIAKATSSKPTDTVVPRKASERVCVYIDSHPQRVRDALAKRYPQIKTLIPVCSEADAEEEAEAEDDAVAE